MLLRVRVVFLRKTEILECLGICFKLFLRPAYCITKGMEDVKGAMLNKIRFVLA